MFMLSFWALCHCAPYQDLLKKSSDVRQLRGLTYADVEEMETMPLGAGVSPETPLGWKAVPKQGRLELLGELLVSGIGQCTLEA